MTILSGLFVMLCFVRSLRGNLETAPTSSAKVRVQGQDVVLNVGRMPGHSPAFRRDRRRPTPALSHPLKNRLIETSSVEPADCRSARF